MSTLETPKGFGERICEIGRLGGMAVRLAWRTSPLLITGILSLVLVQAVLPVVELMLTKVVIDRVALDLGLTTMAEPLADNATPFL